MRIRRVIKTYSTGAASLLVTIMLGFLLIAVVASLSVISNRESQQASDVDLSAKAFSVAQSGIQQDIAKINANPAFEQDACNANPATPGTPQAAQIIDPNTAITCSIVTPKSNQFETSLDRDKSVQINLTGSTVVDSMLLQWDPTSSASAQVPAAFTGSCLIPLNFPELDGGSVPFATNGCSATTDGWEFPAIMEMTFTWWNRSSGSTSFTAADLAGDSGNGNSDLSSKTIIVVPYQNTTSTNQRRDDTVVANTGTVVTTDPGGGLLNACNSSFKYSVSTNVPYNCEVGLVGAGGNISALPLSDVVPGGVASKNLIVRITSRYASTRMVAQFFNSNNPVSILTPSTTIDVTARVNDLYRRTVATKTVTPTIIDFAGNAIYSNHEICKNLQVQSNFTPLAGGDGKNHC